MSRGPAATGDDADAGLAPEDVRPPRETLSLFGHGAAEQAFLAAYQSGRLPHAWLIGGEAGIGKATLAYRIARFVLANPQPERREVTEATSLSLAADHPAVRRIAGSAHPDLLVLERTVGENGKLRTVITVDQVRRLVSFFGSTAGEGGWRIAIVDSADELKYPEGSNALLKMLEEPPPRGLFLLVSHAPGRLLPTIRSRCRRLDLKPLSPDDVLRAANDATDGRLDAARLTESAAAAHGSVARCLAMTGGTLALRERIAALLAALPATDPRGMHALGDQLDRDRGQFDTFVTMVRDWLSARLDAGRSDRSRLARIADAWERLNRTAREVESFNLDRKPAVFAVFGLLAEASAG